MPSVRQRQPADRRPTGAARAWSPRPPGAWATDSRRSTAGAAGVGPTVRLHRLRCLDDRRAQRGADQTSVFKCGDWDVHGAVRGLRDVVERDARLGLAIHDGGRDGGTGLGLSTAMGRRGQDRTSLRGGAAGAGRVVSAQGGGTNCDDVGCVRTAVGGARCCHGGLCRRAQSVMGVGIRLMCFH